MKSGKVVRLCADCYSILKECTFQGKDGPYRWQACVNQECVAYRRIQQGVVKAPPDSEARS